MSPGVSSHGEATMLRAELHKGCNLVRALTRP